MTEADLAARVLAGEGRAAADLMRALDDGLPGAAAVFAVLYPHTGGARVLGITGTPGGGKSTLVDALVTRYRQRGERVGVVAVDPSSPFSGGAILGDRIRMQRHALDPDVFIRSLATRGALGGLSRSTGDVVDVLAAMKFPRVIVETVGVGQDEIDIASLADTTVVVTVPGLGDEVQALKAGILEAADVLVVNKADREGSDRAMRDLAAMLHLRDPGAPAVELLKTTASSGQGVDELVAAVDRHEAVQRKSGGWEQRRRLQAAARVRGIVLDRLGRAVEARIAGAGGIEQVSADVANRRRDPYTTASALLGRLQP